MFLGNQQKIFIKSNFSSISFGKKIRNAVTVCSRAEIIIYSRHTHEQLLNDVHYITVL